MNQPKLHAVAAPANSGAFEDAPSEMQQKQTVHMNRSHSLDTSWAVLTHPYQRPCLTFPDIWEWDFEQIRTAPAIGSVMQIVAANSDEPTLGSEVLPLFTTFQASEWCGKTVLFPRTIFVSKGWGKAILGCVIDEKGICKLEMYCFSHNFAEKVFVAIWKQ